MVYDRIDWHSGSDNFPEELPYENGGTHIGMFLAWAIIHDLMGDIHKENSLGSLEEVKNRTITGREFLIKECDEKFWDDDLSEKGNLFAKYYYESNMYLTDYENAIGGNVESLYFVEDNWENYDKIDPIITAQYVKWNKKNNKKWWQFWNF